MMLHRRVLLLMTPILALAAGSVAADSSVQVHVRECTCVDGVETELADTVRATGGSYRTQRAPDVEGRIFTGWTISTVQDFSSRDRHGRAYDAAPYTVYEAMTLTANYMAADVDTDEDGIPDGYELYWYGDLSVGADADTDGDGYTFAQEIAAGTNPLLKDAAVNGGVVWSEGDEKWYNPRGYQPVVVKSEPEGALFETVTTYLSPGSAFTSPVCDRLTTAFAYWTLNGERQADRRGRAVDRVKLTVPDEPVTLVAVVVEDESLRDQLYWYGHAVAADSDTDGDGYTFAQEMAAGTNPLLKDTAINGGVVWADGEETVYHSPQVHLCVIRSEPEGELFETIEEWYVEGELVVSPQMDRDGTAFAYWTLNGERQSDRRGRARDVVSFDMPEEDVELVAVALTDDFEREQQYWYGRAETADSDTDGDGYTFAQEIAAGTNPLLPDATVSGGGVVWADSTPWEVNMQPFEQVRGVVIGETFSSFEELGGKNLQPVVADANGDGLWDLVLVYDGGVKVLVNVGSKGNPRFVEQSGGTPLPPEVDLAMNSTEKLAGMTLDVEPVGALSATLWGGTMLVSDGEGRIWYYLSAPRSEDAAGTVSYALQHKVWGGSYAGFAAGLRLAAVDWEDDGDLDCLCGTADGKLMLLRDPKVGRPTNLSALAGVDNVLLEWDPNAQSRIRGYNVYRSASDADSYEKLTAEHIPLPTYRDTPQTIRDYDYRVTSVSRFYTAGNSTPTVSESVPSEPVRAELGKVELALCAASGFSGREVEVPLSVNNSFNLKGEGLKITVAYDAAVLTPKSVKTTVLTEGVTLESSVAEGLWTVTGKGGTVEPGTGMFLTFVFTVAAEAEEDETDVEVVEAEARSVVGVEVTVPMPICGVVSIEEFVPPDPSYVPIYGQGDLSGDGRLGWDDIELMQTWKDRKFQDLPPEAVRAGDYNGDGVVDNRDYAQMRKDFREREKAGGDMAGWDKNHNNGGGRKK